MSELDDYSDYVYSRQFMVNPGPKLTHDEYMRTKARQELEQWAPSGSQE